MQSTISFLSLFAPFCTSLPFFGCIGAIDIVDINDVIEDRGLLQFVFVYPFVLSFFFLRSGDMKINEVIGNTGFLVEFFQNSAVQSVLYCKLGV